MKKDLSRVELSQHVARKGSARKLRHGSARSQKSEAHPDRKNLRLTPIAKICPHQTRHGNLAEPNNLFSRRQRAGI